MGVADGVYMWKEMGIDSGTMSRFHMETAMHMVQAGCEDIVQGEEGGGSAGKGCCMLY
jgi:protein phosphatase PTC7